MSECKHGAMMFGPISNSDSNTHMHLRHTDHCIFCGSTKREIELEKRVLELEEELKNLKP